MEIGQRVKDYWTQRSHDFGTVRKNELENEMGQRWLHEIERFLPEGRSLDILDVGTGTGFFAVLLAQQGHRVEGIDLTPAMLEEARTLAKQRNLDITFREMDAQNLAYPDDTFDVVISRNLTWTLPDPQRAYAEWFRVLKPGGVLLNFDANWYRYLWDEDAQAAHTQDRENLQASDVRDETAGTDVDAMEAIARKTPLSKLHRPAWDLDVLRGLGMQAAADTEVWKQVWTKEERINNASTPMFLVEGHKGGESPLTMRYELGQ